MRLKVHHETQYSYEDAPSYLVQRLYLTPANFASQKVVKWTIEAPGIDEGLRYADAAGNIIHLVTTSSFEGSATIIAKGEVETSDAAGVIRNLQGTVPEAVFLRKTPATLADDALKAFAKPFAGKAPILERCHALMKALHEQIAYETGTSDAATTAAEAFAAKRGVCQDHAHLMIAVAREIGIPARYVTGYLVTGEGASSSAAHAWAELFVADLGWVGFDATNDQCPTDHYVRVAAGHDAIAVAPVRGSRRGGGGREHLTVEVRVEIAQQ